MTKLTIQAEQYKVEALQEANNFCFGTSIRVDVPGDVRQKAEAVEAQTMKALRLDAWAKLGTK